MSSKHLKEVPLLGLAKAKALALSNANLLARNIDPQKISPLPYCQPYIQFCVLPPSIAINLPDIASLRITLWKQQLVLLGFFDARDFFGLHLRTTQRKTEKGHFHGLCNKLTPLFGLSSYLDVYYVMALSKSCGFTTHLWSVHQSACRWRNDSKTGCPFVGNEKAWFVLGPGWWPSISLISVSGRVFSGCLKCSISRNARRRFFIRQQ